MANNKFLVGEYTLEYCKIFVYINEFKEKSNRKKTKHQNPTASENTVWSPFLFQFIKVTEGIMLMMIVF